MSSKKKDRPQDEESKVADAQTEAEAKTDAETEPSADAGKAGMEIAAKETPPPTPEEELNDEKDKYLRLLAEYDNFRKRSQKERESIYADVRTDTVLRFLPVYDNLSRALMQETADEAYRKGIEMTMNQLKEVLEKLGVSEIPALGETFNPELHNAVMHVEEVSSGESKIVEVFQPGFKLGDKIIRFAMVKVAN